MTQYLTAWQKVIFRNYSYVPARNIAKVLGTTEAVIEAEARKTGLGKFRYNPDWLKKGFVTIIRENWDILTKEQLLILTGFSEKEFDALLKDYDFLDVKLGDKPNVSAPVYGVPQADERGTAKVRETVEEVYVEPTAKPFDFYTGDGYEVKVKEYAIKDRYTSNYCAKYTDVLLDDELADYSDEYLTRLKKTGVNGVWLHETLRNLAEFPFDKSLSPDYEIRIKNLKKLTERCAAHGVGVYLYLNEPRSLPGGFFEKYPELRGQKVSDNEYCLCTSDKRVREYLYNAVKSVVTGAPMLKGIMTITMSENPTHCYSRSWDDKLNYTECPVCAKRKPYEVVAELNNVICAAIKDNNPYTSYIVNLWGWAEYMGWTMEETYRGIELLDTRADVLSVSEFDKEFTRGGVTSRVIDYSISVVGPSEYTVNCLNKARETGHRIWAKVQVNNSWECSSVPYLPVFDLMTEHIERLKALGVTGIMLGWSLGGYPGGALPACCMACGKDKFDLFSYCKELYGENARNAETAMKIFGEAFREYPFSVGSLYCGAQTLGCANLWSIEPDNRKSTMVCYSFDDEDSWSYPYGLEIYTAQYKKMCDKWKEGLDYLSGKTGNALFAEYKRMAEASYAHFYSTLLHAEFVALKKDVKGNAEKIKEILKKEYENTVNLYKLFSSDAKIGFEMTNHYYYTPSALIEKLIDVKEISESL